MREVDPWHGLLAISQWATDKEAHREGHEREHPTLARQSNARSCDYVAYAEISKALSRGFCFKRDVCQIIAAWWSCLVRNRRTPRSIIVDPRDLDKHPGAGVRCLYCRDEGSGRKHARIDGLLFLCRCPRPVAQAIARQIDDDIHTLDGLAPRRGGYSIPLDLKRILRRPAGKDPRVVTRRPQIMHQRRPQISPATCDQDLHMGVSM